MSVLLALTGTLLLYRGRQRHFLAGMTDNVLKPLLLSRGVDAPMPVILLGALGGMATRGHSRHVCRCHAAGAGLSDIHGMGGEQVGRRRLRGTGRSPCGELTRLSPPTGCGPQQSGRSMISPRPFDRSRKGGRSGTAAAAETEKRYTPPMAGP